MRPLASWPLDTRRTIVGVLTDIDDTLTTDGAITPDALAALADLRRAGYPVFAVTGRPAGWSEPFARAWSLDAIVAENGAVALFVDPRTNGLEKRYVDDPETRRENRLRLRRVRDRVVTQVRGAAPARDSAGRETDIAIDHSEFTTLPQADIDRVVAIMRSEGLRATVSSIHVNGWIGDHDKFTGAAWIVRQRLDRDLAAEIDRWVYVGDSTNDAIPFARFPNSVGVANVRRFERELAALPAYIADGERGAGFAQVARQLISSRILEQPR